MTESDAKNFIKGKVEEQLNNVKVFYDKVQNDQREGQILSAKIVKAREANEEEGFEESKENLIRMQELHYNTFLLDTSLRQSQCLLYEYNTMAKLFGVELKFEGETQNFFDQAVKDNPYMFTVDKGKVVMIKTTETDAAMRALEDKMRSEENLKAIYKNMK